MTRKVRTSIISIRLMPTPATTRCMLLASWSQRSLGIEKGDYRRLRALEPLTPTLYDHWTDQSGRRFVRAHPSAAFHVPRFRSPLAEVKPLDPFRATKWLLPAFFSFPVPPHLTGHVSILPYDESTPVEVGFGMHGGQRVRPSSFSAPPFGSFRTFECVANAIFFYSLSSEEYFTLST
jgi:hypothetical protein